MLTLADEPTIRNAILRRLSKERGIQIADILVVPRPDCIRVGVLFTKDGPQKGDAKLIVRSIFELPPQFQHAHLIAEIDEIAEGAKQAKRDWGIGSAIIAPDVRLKGTGERGNWIRYA